MIFHEWWHRSEAIGIVKKSNVAVDSSGNPRIGGIGGPLLAEMHHGHRELVMLGEMAYSGVVGCIGDIEDEENASSEYLHRQQFCLWQNLFPCAVDIV